MKNILFVVDEQRMGGVSILLKDILNNINLKNRNIDILILHNTGNMLENLPKNINIIYGTNYFETVDLTIKEVLKSRNIKSILKKIKLVLDMKTGFIKYKIKKERKKILKKSYDIEIAFKDGFTAIFTSLGDSKYKIHWLHYDYKLGNPNKKYNKLFNELLPKFDKIIAVSKNILIDFNNIYHLEKKSIVINNYIDIKRIKEMVKGNKKAKKQNSIKFILVGRLHPVKGYDRFIEVINKLNEEINLSNVTFEIYGDGTEKNILNDKIMNYKLENLIKLKGQVLNPYIYIEQSDMLLLPSYYESFGLVIVESMSLGTPVLTTKTSAAEELINNNKNGLIVENSTDGIYNGLKKIILNRKLIDLYNSNLKDYNYEKKNKKIIEEIEKLLK